MANKPETIAQLKRKIEFLEAQLTAAKELAERNMKAYASALYDKVDMETRLN